MVWLSSCSATRSVEPAIFSILEYSSALCLWSVLPARADIHGPCGVDLGGVSSRGLRCRPDRGTGESRSRRKGQRPVSGARLSAREPQLRRLHGKAGRSPHPSRPDCAFRTPSQSASAMGPTLARSFSVGTIVASGNGRQRNKCHGGGAMCEMAGPRVPITRTLSVAHLKSRAISSAAVRASASASLSAARSI